MRSGSGLRVSHIQSPRLVRQFFSVSYRPQRPYGQGRRDLRHIIGRPWYGPHQPWLNLSFCRRLNDSYHELVYSHRPGLSTSSLSGMSLVAHVKGPGLFCFFIYFFLYDLWIPSTLANRLFRAAIPQVTSRQWVGSSSRRQRPVAGPQLIVVNGGLTVTRR